MDLSGEQIGAVPVPQIWEPIGEVVQLSPQERVQNFYLGADFGCPCASAHGGRLAGRTTRACATSYAGADCGYPCASDHGRWLARCTVGACKFL